MDRMLMEIIKAIIESSNALKPEWLNPEHALESLLQAPNSLKSIPSKYFTHSAERCQASNVKSLTF